jgi:hypothetical protein
VGVVVAELLSWLEAEWIDPDTEPTQKRIILTMVCSYIVVAFGGYFLRGHEGFWTDAGWLCEAINTGRNTPEGEPMHVVISLSGRFKGEQGMRMHTFPLNECTRSGIRIRLWLERVVKVLLDERKENYPAFCDGDEGYQLTVRRVEEGAREKMQNDASLKGLIAEGVLRWDFYRCLGHSDVVLKIRPSTTEYQNLPLN